MLFRSDSTEYYDPDGLLRESLAPIMQASPNGVVRVTGYEWTQVSYDHAERETARKIYYTAENKFPNITPASANVLMEPVYPDDTATTEIYTLSLHDALPIWATGLAMSSSSATQISSRSVDSTSWTTVCSSLARRGKAICAPKT